MKVNVIGTMKFLNQYIQLNAAIYNGLC